MDLEQELERARKLQQEAAERISEIRGTGVQFIMQELATGIAFAKLAQDSRLRGDNAVADGQKDRAREALQTVLKFLAETTPTAEQKTTIEASIAELNSKLAALEALPNP